MCTDVSLLMPIPGCHNNHSMLLSICSYCPHRRALPCKATADRLRMNKHNEECKATEAGLRMRKRTYCVSNTRRDGMAPQLMDASRTFEAEKVYNSLRAVNNLTWRERLWGNWWHSSGKDNTSYVTVLLEVTHTVNYKLCVLVPLHYKPLPNQP